MRITDIGESETAQRIYREFRVGDIVQILPPKLKPSTNWRYMHSFIVLYRAHNKYALLFQGDRSDFPVDWIRVRQYPSLHGTDFLSECIHGHSKFLLLDKLSKEEALTHPQEVVRQIAKDIC